MLDRSIVIPIAGMLMIITLALGIPLMVALIRKWERNAKQMPRLSGGDDARLERIEAAVEAMAIEVERISEGQRFAAKLLADRVPAAGGDTRSRVMREGS